MSGAADGPSAPAVASPTPTLPAVRAALLLAQGWLARGHPHAAAAQLERARQLAPTDAEVHRQLAHLHLHRESYGEAATHMAQSVAALPPTDPRHAEAVLLRELAGEPPAPVALPAAPHGKLRFPARYDREHHRSGWRYAMEALYPLHHPDGVRFEGFLDEPFGVDHPREGVRAGPALLDALRRPSYATRWTAEERRIIPIREPWVGVWHNPQGMPPWFRPDLAPELIMDKAVWRESLPHCRGLFALSEHHASWLRSATSLPVSVVHLPCEIPERQFDFERFLANPEKRLVQIGWWLRRLTAIDRLPLAADAPVRYRRLRLIPGFAPNAAAHLDELRALEAAADPLPVSVDGGAVETWSHLPNGAYDDLLAESIAFVHLYAASANNVVVECLARGTPLLVNRLPAVEEYLGSEYPLYYDSLADAAAHAVDLPRLRAAHDYLRHSPLRARLSSEAFRQSMEQSEVYQRL
jgi:hypothetical protein